MKGRKFTSPIFILMMIVLSGLLLSGCTTSTNTTDTNGKRSPKNLNVVRSTFTDSRDGNTYKTVEIEGQIWMAENLQFDSGCTQVVYEEYWDGGWCGCPGSYMSYEPDPSMCSKYGLLYQWSAMMTWDGWGYPPAEGIQGVCPNGWRVPTDSDWKTLELAIGLEDVDTTDWRGDVASSLWSTEYGGDNTTSFSALPAGSRLTDGMYQGEGNHTSFWTSSEVDGLGWSRLIKTDEQSIERNMITFAAAQSVRCVR